jgi:hypothetical protein
MFKNGFSWLGIGGELKDNVLICLEMASTGMGKPFLNISRRNIEFTSVLCHGKPFLNISRQNFEFTSVLCHGKPFLNIPRRNFEFTSLKVTP